MILASGSPRRLDLLRQAGIEPLAVVLPDVDEAMVTGETPRHLAERLATDKVRAVAAQHPKNFVLAADTVVACGRRVLDKTDEVERARWCLALLSGRRHRVTTAVALSDPTGRATVKSSETIVRFKRLTAREIEAYLASGEWQGKAGGYAIQGRADAFVKQLNGSYSNVVGLPLELTLRLLVGRGWRPPCPT